MPQITSFARQTRPKTPALSVSSREPCDVSVDVVVFERATRAGRDVEFVGSQRVRACAFGRALAAHEDAGVEGEPLDFRAVRFVVW